MTSDRAIATLMIASDATAPKSRSALRRSSTFDTLAGQKSLRNAAGKTNPITLGKLDFDTAKRNRFELTWVVTLRRDVAHLLPNSAPRAPHPMIITIDGPAGAGKSLAARRLAKKLGFRFLDTGAMYRAVTLAGLREGIDWQDTGALARIAARLQIELTDDQVQLNGEDVTKAIRSFEVTTLTKHAADNLAVRERLIELQRAYSQGKSLVTEGRDQATVVFPNAALKIYLTASDAVRAQRRFEDLISRGEQVTLEEVLEKQLQRDQRDLEREFGGLRKADDSIEVCTDGLSADEVVAELERLVRDAKN